MTDETGEHPRDGGDADGFAGEPLFAPSVVRLFGRLFTGLELTDNLGLSANSNNPLSSLLRAKEQAAIDGGAPVDFRLARIYGFSYLGAYYPTPEVPVMLVFGDGTEVPAGFRNTLEVGGVAYAKEVFAHGVRAWELDSLDAAVRIDVQVGWLSDILMADAMADPTTPAPAERPGMGGRAHAMSSGVHMMQRQRPPG